MGAVGVLDILADVEIATGVCVDVSCVILTFEGVAGVVVIGMQGGVGNRSGRSGPVSTSLQYCSDGVPYVEERHRSAHIKLILIFIIITNV